MELMQRFVSKCSSVISGIIDIDTNAGTLYGESSSEDQMPLEESIYLENRLYSIECNIKDEEENTVREKYEINFYRKDTSLVCELVKILQK